MTLYPDWYLAFCAVFLVVVTVALVVSSWLHKR